MTHDHRQIEKRIAGRGELPINKPQLRSAHNVLRYRIIVAKRQTGSARVGRLEGAAGRARHSLRGNSASQGGIFVKSTFQIQRREIRWRRNGFVQPPKHHSQFTHKPWVAQGQPGAQTRPGSQWVTRTPWRLSENTGCGPIPCPRMARRISISAARFRPSFRTTGVSKRTTRRSVPLAASQVSFHPPPPESRRMYRRRPSPGSSSGGAARFTRAGPCARNGNRTRPTPGSWRTARR